MIKNRLRLGFKIFWHSMVYFLFFCFIFYPVQAGILDDSYSTKEIILVIGEAKSFRVNNPTQVKIGNPDLMDVVGASNTELLLSGLKEGETALTIVDGFGPHTYTVKIFTEDLEKIKERVDILLQAAGFDQLTTKIGDKERKIFILGELSLAKKDLLDSRIESIKDKIINLVDFTDDVLSVEIDVEVLDIDKDAVDNLGFQWSPAGEVTISNARLTDFLSPSHTLKVLKFPWEQDTWSVTLNYLKTRDKVRILSRPKLVCLSGKEASLLVGGERPIITGSSTTSGSGSTATNYDIEMMEYGIKLSIKPTIIENREIQISLTTEISEIDENQSLQLDEDTSTPGKITSEATTELTVMSGQTVLIAGLIQSRSEENKQGISGLEKIPLLGALFRYKNLENNEREIVITLTPTIIRADSKTGEVSGSSTSKVELPAVSSDSSIVGLATTAATAQPKKDDPVVSYSLLIQDIINSNIRYPKELREQKVEGSVKLSLHLISNGELSGVIIAQTSGNQLLDEAAEKSVKKLSPFPAFPTEVNLKELWVEIPIVFSAKNQS